MKLTLLTIETTAQAKVPPGVVPFRNLAHHVKEVFMEQLSPIEINGSSKIEISFGPQGDEDKFDNVLGVTNYFVEDFNFFDFYSLNDHDRDRLILDKIKSALIETRGSDRVQDSVIEKISLAYCKTIECGFNTKILVRNLSKSSKIYSVNVYRILNSRNGEVWQCEFENKTTLIKKEILMTKNPDYLDRRNYFRKAKIDNGVFIVSNTLGNMAFECKLE